jgi:hypothetical protein
MFWFFYYAVIGKLNFLWMRGMNFRHFFMFVRIISIDRILYSYVYGYLKRVHLGISAPASVPLLFSQCIGDVEGFFCVEVFSM